MFSFLLNKLKNIWHFVFISALLLVLSVWAMALKEGNSLFFFLAAAIVALGTIIYLIVYYKPFYQALESSVKIILQKNRSAVIAGSVIWLLMIVIFSVLSYHGLFFIPHLDFEVWFFSGLVIAFLLGFICFTNPDNLFKDDEEIQGKWFWILTIILLSVGLLLRWMLMGMDFFSVDELYHLNGAQTLLNGHMPDYRQYFAYTFLVALGMKIFSGALWAARLPGMAFNLLTIFFLIYYLRKWFNAFVGLMGGILLAFSTWHILNAPFIRMYNLVQFFFLLSVILLIEAVSAENKRRKIIYGALALASYGLSGYFHPVVLTALPLLIILVFGFGLGAMARADRLMGFKKIISHFPWASVAGWLMLALGSYLIFTEKIGALLTGIDITYNPIKVAGNNYLDYVLNQFYPPITLLIWGAVLFFGFFLIKKNKALLVLTVLSLGSLLELLFVVDRYFATKYLFHILPLLTALTAVGLYGLYKILRNIIKTIIRNRLLQGIFCDTVIFGLILLMLLPALDLLKSQTYLSLYESGQNPIGEIYYPYRNIDSLTAKQGKASYIQINDGIWEIFKNNVKDIYTLRTYNRLNGEKYSAQKVVKDFLGYIKEKKYGYYITDQYRHKQWECGEGEMPPCFFRYITKRFFQETPAKTLENLILYQWEVLQPDKSFLPHTGSSQDLSGYAIVGFELPDKNKSYFIIRLSPEKRLEKIAEGKNALGFVTITFEQGDGGEQKIGKLFSLPKVWSENYEYRFPVENYDEAKPDPVEWASVDFQFIDEKNLKVIHPFGQPIVLGQERS